MTGIPHFEGRVALRQKGHLAQRQAAYGLASGNQSLLRFEKSPDINAERVGEALQRIHGDIPFPSLHA